MSELDRDRERGLLDDTMIEAARLEIHRRMLVAEKSETVSLLTSERSENSRRRRLAVLLPLIPLAALAWYSVVGNPSLPGRPYFNRQSDPEFQTDQMIAHVQTEMGQAPTARGLHILGDLLAGRNRYDEAAEAYRRAIAKGDNQAETFSSLGESLAMVNDGAIIPEARADFLDALRRDREDPRARFYLGLAEAQIGDNRKAVAIWRDLERDSGADIPWLGMLREHITVFAKQGGFDQNSVDPVPPALPDGTPTGRAAAAIASAPPQDQVKMIRSMVEGLAAKLENRPDDLDGWLRLARAYKVLGETGKESAAKQRAARLIDAMPEGSPSKAEMRQRLEEMDGSASSPQGHSPAFQP